MTQAGMADNPSGCARCEPRQKDIPKVKYLYGIPSANFLAQIEKVKEELAVSSSPL